MGTVDDAGRLQLIYDNIVGLATAGVVTVLPSAEELAEGLAHLDLPPKDDAELSACLWVLEGALGECPAPSFEEFLMKATDLSYSPTASLGTNLSSDRPDCLQLAQGGSKGFPSPQSFLSSDDNDEDEAQEDQDRNRAMQTLRSSLQSSLRSSPPPVQLTFPEKGDLVSLLADAVEQMSLLQREVKSSSAHKLSSFIQDLLAAALNQAQELERNLASAVEGIRKSRELVQQIPGLAMAALGEAEEILLYYSGESALDPPKPYKMSRILYQDAGNGVFVITLNDPARLNCMSLNLAQEVSLLLEHVKRDERCKVIVWTGAGRAFSAGGNFTDASTTVPEEVYEGYVRAGIATRLPDISLSGPTRAMIKLPKLSIAAVNGMAIGGGVNLALVWQDFVYVSQDAVFRYPFGELGLTPELGSSVLLPQVVGLVRAKELLQLGREFSAKEALEMGLCTAVVPQEEVLGKAIEAAKKLAAMPQFALRESKRLLNKDLVARIDSITEEELKAFKKVVADPETVKAMMSLAKRTSKSKLQFSAGAVVWTYTQSVSDNQLAGQVAGWDYSKNLLAELSRAEAESQGWHAKWTATFSDLEALRRKQATVLAQAKAQAASLSGEPGSSLNRTSLGQLLRSRAGPAAVAFAWFRASAALCQMRRRRAAEMDKLASAHCLERLRRRLGPGGRGPRCPSPPSPTASSPVPKLALDLEHLRSNLK
eukprot:s3511_g6.t1